MPAPSGRFMLALKVGATASLQQRTRRAMDDVWKSIKEFQRAHRASVCELLVLDVAGEPLPRGVYRYDLGRGVFEAMSKAIAMHSTGERPPVQQCVIHRLDDASMVYVKNEERRHVERRACLQSGPVLDGAFLLSYYAASLLPPERFPSTASLDARVVCERAVLPIQRGLRCRMEIQEGRAATPEARRYRIAIEVDDAHADGAKLEALAAAIAAARAAT